MLPSVKTEDFEKIAPEVAKDWLRRALMLLPEEDREELLRPFRKKHEAVP